MTAPAAPFRLAGVDATRGIALLGMMATHALYAYDDDGDPTVVFSLAAGRSAAIFAVLAGVGIAFVTGRRRVERGRPAAAAAAALAARGAVIGVIGLALGYTDAAIAAVILPYYAVLYLLAIPLVLLGTRALVVTGALVAVVMPVLSHLVRPALPEPELTNPTFEYLFSDPFGLLTELLLTGYFPALPWAAYLCIGIAVGRMRLDSPQVAARLLAAGGAVAVAGSFVSWLLLGPLGGLDRLAEAGADVGLDVDEILAFGGEGVSPTTTWWWLASDAVHTATPPDLLHTGGCAVALLGGLLLLGHVGAPAGRRALATALAPLAAAGSIPLTLYTAHIVFMNSPLDTFDAIPGYLVQVVAGLVFALLWRRIVGRGPLESVASWAGRRARAAVGSRPDHRSADMIGR